ncbi:twin-arginine translocase TatA/TatE family subunit [uncultured Microbacterium sp.]|jgi:sec-independent protein translocase protein TatB|uniref:twin-arginine translocase TatA/TatE family subunit n=1 Tax=uncultured Microbacterium sp. TaxID=191216 RepID=UPI0025E11E83|nr:twin-arginine translocase TatA/TatE family subunit [uncultured Microbacterium sp.]
MSFGWSWDKLLLIGLIAVLVIGPERLPRYAETLASFVKRARVWASGAKDRLKEEMGEDFDDVDWRKLDPRQYDPRRIVREALLDDPPLAPVAAASVKPVSAVMTPAPDALGGATPTRTPALEPGAVPPFDAEAT